MNFVADFRACGAFLEVKESRIKSRCMEEQSLDILNSTDF